MVLGCLNVSHCISDPYPNSKDIVKPTFYFISDIIVMEVDRLQAR